MNNQKVYSSHILEFLFNLDLKLKIPDSIETMNPFTDEAVKEICTQFYSKYYKNNKPRTFIIGINPGRFGAGITGIPFSDPIRLEEDCEIPNSFEKKQELSSVFIYDMINAYGGPELFYSRFYITSVSPLGFVMKGKNLNYYDRKDLENALLPFIVQSLQEQIKFGANRNSAICLGEGKNYKFLRKLNEEYNFFSEILPLPHPRFVMQYRYKSRKEYVRKYVDVLNQAVKGFE